MTMRSIAIIVFCAGVFASLHAAIAGGLIGELGDRIEQGRRDVAGELGKPPAELVKRAEQARADLMRDIERTGYSSNKPERKRKVEEGGWIVAYSDDITETDAINGIVAAGVSIYTENPTLFREWVDNLTRRTFRSLQENAEHTFPDALRTQLRDIAVTEFKTILTTFQRFGVDAMNEVAVDVRDFGNFDFKAGGFYYSGENRVGEYVLPGRTGGIKLYVAFRWRPGTILKPLGRGFDTLVSIQEDLKSQSYTTANIQRLSREDSLHDLAALSSDLWLFRQLLAARNKDTTEIDRVNTIVLDSIRVARTTTLDLKREEGWRRALLLLGYNPGPSGSPDTERAVRRFQWKHDCDVDGFVGDQTRSALRVALDEIGVPHDEPTSIDLRTSEGIQRALFLLGFDPGPVDGDIGPQTMRAIKRYQEQRNLVVDGHAGGQTRDALHIDLESIKVQHRYDK